MDDVEEQKQIKVLAFGDVQMVGYRGLVIQLARKRGVRGTVENLNDGSVRIFAQGTRIQLEDFLKAIEIQNGMVNVERLEVEYPESTEDFDGFSPILGNLTKEIFWGFNTLSCCGKTS